MAKNEQCVKDVFNAKIHKDLLILLFYPRHLICPVPGYSYLIGHGDNKMIKLITGLGLMLIASVATAKPYECTGYLDGKAVGTITVNAAKTPVAETKGADRMRKAGTKVDYMKCK